MKNFLVHHDNDRAHTSPKKNTDFNQEPVPYPSDSPDIVSWDSNLFRSLPKILSGINIEYGD